MSEPITIVQKPDGTCDLIGCVFGACSEGCHVGWDIEQAWDKPSRPGPHCPGPGVYRLVREQDISRLSF